MYFVNLFFGQTRINNKSYWKSILSTYFSDKKGGIEQIKIEIDTQLNYRIEIIPKLLKNRRIHEITDEVIEKSKNPIESNWILELN